jgi:hypothetical protein
MPQSKLVATINQGLLSAGGSVDPPNELNELQQLPLTQAACTAEKG